MVGIPPNVCKQICYHNYTLMMILYVKFRFKGERLWLRVLRFDGDVVVGRVWNLPMNHGLLCGQLIGVPIIDIIYIINIPASAL